MTAFPDPPPQSRRAVRQSERGEVPTEATPPALPYSFDSAPANPAEPADAPERDTRPTGRRVQLSPPSPEANDASDPSRSPFRQRDFSPEGRRAALGRDQFSNVTSGVIPLTTPDLRSAPAPSNTPVDLDYFTHGAPASRLRDAPPPVTTDQTLTRRALRELRAAQEAPTASGIPEPIDTLLHSGPIVLPTLVAGMSDSDAMAAALAEYDRLAGVTAVPNAAVPQASPPVPSVPAAPTAFAAPSSPPALVEPPAVIAPPVDFASLVHFDPPEADAQVAAPVRDLMHTDAAVPVGASALSPTAPPPADALPLADAVAPAPTDSLAAPVEAAVQAPAAEAVAPEQGPLEEAVAEDTVPAEAEREAYTPPVGHWSIQAEIDDDEQNLENTISRTIGAGSVAITTSALVLPSVGQPDLINSLTSTGEILVTGSIDLPRSLSSTGAHPHRVDNSDFDDDPLDHQEVAADSAPVRAIRAVSSHTSTRGVIESKRPQSNRLPTVMIVVASVLAVTVVGLLITAAVTHLF